MILSDYIDRLDRQTLLYETWETGMVKVELKLMSEWAWLIHLALLNSASWGVKVVYHWIKDLFEKGCGSKRVVAWFKMSSWDLCRETEKNHENAKSILIPYRDLNPRYLDCQAIRHCKPPLLSFIISATSLSRSEHQYIGLFLSCEDLAKHKQELYKLVHIF